MGIKERQERDREAVRRAILDAARELFVRDMKARLAGQPQECMNGQVMPPVLNAAVGVRVLTMGILGVSVMRLSDRLGPNENADDLARDVLDVLIAGLQSGLALRSKGLL